MKNKYIYMNRVIVIINKGIKAEAVLVPEWSNGVDCKSIIRRFESDPALKYGAVVKLGERLPCTEEVAGSSPVSSTKY